MLQASSATTLMESTTFNKLGTISGFQLTLKNLKPRAETNKRLVVTVKTNFDGNIKTSGGSRKADVEEHLGEWTMGRGSLLETGNLNSLTEWMG